MSEAIPKLHSVTEAAEAIGVSPTSVRTYTDYYAAHLSKYATGRPRRYTTEDLRIMAYVAYSVAELNRTHEQTLDVIIDELNSFTWDGPARSGPSASAQDPGPSESTALVPVSLLRAAQTMLQDRDKELQRLRDELQVQRGRVEQLQHDNGRLSGQLGELRRPWWKRLLGLND